MMPTDGEDKFQDWVQDRITGAGGHFQDHRFSAQNDVPDLSCALAGRDYWLELKYGEFALRHDGYDDFYFNTMKRGQLEWLIKRSQHGQATCGVLGYFVAKGDHSSDRYLFFMTANKYLAHIWTKKRFDVGAVMLLPCSMRADECRTGRDLFSFIDGAARRPLRN